jgi:hypothetical protein
MFKKLLLIQLSILLITNSLFANDCLPNIEQNLPSINLPNLNLEIDSNSYFCFDQNSIARDQTEILTLYETLNKKGVFDSSHCLIEKKYEYVTSMEITNLIIQTIKSKLNFYTTDKATFSKESLIVMSNTKSESFLKKAFESSEKFTTKDTLEIATATLSSSLIGVAIQRTSGVFKNTNGSLQQDKALHANVGALINIGGVAGAYVLIETAGLGDKLGLSKNKKKWAILLTGTVLGILAGYGKERFYDYYHQDVHTYDPRLKGDMGATLLGGGILNPMMGSISFQW